MSKLKFTFPSRCQLGTYLGTAARSLPWRGQGQPDENRQASPAPVPDPARPAQRWPWRWAGLGCVRTVRRFPSLSSGPVCACLLLLRDLGPPALSIQTAPGADSHPFKSLRLGFLSLVGPSHRKVFMQMGVLHFSAGYGKRFLRRKR